MGRYALFQMWEPFRQKLIAGHLFYVDQANKRLLSQFSDIEKEADMAAERWLEDNSHRYDPDRHNPGDFEERAYDEAVEFYQLLSDMRERTRLSVVAGMYHEWEKQLHQWMADQMRGWCSGTKFEAAVWKATLTDIANLFAPIGWNIRSKAFFRQLDACRLVVNVYKHGNGDSLKQLKKKYPEYLHDPVADLLNERFYNVLDHKHLSVTDKQFRAFSEAIVSFWRNVPENIYDDKNSSAPQWLSKACGESINTNEQKQGGRK